MLNLINLKQIQKIVIVIVVITLLFLIIRKLRLSVLNNRKSPPADPSKFNHNKSFMNALALETFKVLDDTFATSTQKIDVFRKVNTQINEEEFKYYVSEFNKKYSSRCLFCDKYTSIREWVEGEIILDDWNGERDTFIKRLDYIGAA